jgi:hypothetical protein
VTFKDLQKLIESQPDYYNPRHSELERLRGKEFWYCEPATHKEVDKMYRPRIMGFQIISKGKRNNNNNKLITEYSNL